MDGASPPIEALSQPINLDKSNSGKTIDTRKPKRPADNRLYDDDSVDLSSMPHPSLLLPIVNCRRGKKHRA